MIADIVKKNLFHVEDFIFGFADLKGLVSKKFDGFHYGISIGKRLNDKIIDDIMNGPTIEYYNHYHQINNELAILTWKIQADLKRAGVESIPIEPTVSPGTEGYNDEYLKTGI